MTWAGFITVVGCVMLTWLLEARGTIASLLHISYATESNAAGVWKTQSSYLLETWDQDKITDHNIIIYGLRQHNRNSDKFLISLWHNTVQPGYIIPRTVQKQWRLSSFKIVPRSKIATDLHVCHIVVDLADWSMGLPTLIRQWRSTHLGRQTLDGDSGSIVETRLWQADLQSWICPKRFVHVPTAK